MDKDAAIALKDLSLNAIESLGKILTLPGVKDDAIFYGKIHRAVGELIGEVEVKILAEIYKPYPDLDDLGG
jgi:hypothetical protein